MHGVPKDLDLKQFINLELAQICLGEHIIHFRFDSSISVSVEGSWILKNSSSQVIDQNNGEFRKNSEKEFYKLHILLGKKVIKTLVDSPKSFSLIFEENYELKLLDDSENFESISIEPTNIVI